MSDARAVFELQSAIVTERLLLRAYRLSDVDDLHDIQSRPEVMRYLYDEVRTREEVEELIQKRIALTRLQTDDDGLVLAAERQEDGRVIGDVSLTLRSAYHLQGEIGFVFHPDSQGRGYAREAAAAVLHVAFAELGLRRVYGRTDVRNEGSARLMRRLGMRQEAHLRENEIFKGEWSDELVFAILQREWLA
jgi:RimJ/RimL family protein N-acetyltransferase